MFETQIRRGRVWVHAGVVRAPDAKTAATRVALADGVEEGRARPEGSRERWVTYRNRRRRVGV